MVVLKEFYFDSVNILRGTLQFPLKLQKNLSVKGTTHIAVELISSNPAGHHPATCSSWPWFAGFGRLLRDSKSVILFWVFSFLMIHFSVTWAITNIKVILSSVGQKQ